MKPLCDICGDRHESWQSHRFATNIASNKRLTDATNKESNATNRVDGAVGIPEVSGGLPGSVVQNVSGMRKVGGDTRTANRRSREAYNAYQREYMRKWRLSRGIGCQARAIRVDSW